MQTVIECGRQIGVDAIDDQIFWGRGIDNMVDHHLDDTIVLIGVWVDPGDIPLLVAEGNVEVVDQVEHNVVVESPDISLCEYHLIAGPSSFSIASFVDGSTGRPIESKGYSEFPTLNDDLITTNDLADLSGVEIAKVVRKVADGVIDSVSILIDCGWDGWHLGLDLIECFVEFILVAQTVAG